MATGTPWLSEPMHRRERRRPRPHDSMWHRGYLLVPRQVRNDERETRDGIDPARGVTQEWEENADESKEAKEQNETRVASWVPCRARGQRRTTLGRARRKSQPGECSGLLWGRCWLIRKKRQQYNLWLFHQMTMAIPLAPAGRKRGRWLCWFIFGGRKKLFSTLVVACARGLGTPRVSSGAWGKTHGHSRPRLSGGDPSPVHPRVALHG